MLKRRHLLGYIMIAEDSDHAQAGIDALENALHGRINAVTRTVNLITVIASHHAEVHLKPAQALAKSVGKAREPISVKVSQVEYRKAAEAFR
jgi:hypothetical protein